MKHHKTIAVRLKGAKQAERMIGEIMESQLQETYINMMNIDIITGTGGLLSHAPKRVQTFQILMDAWQPEGVTKVYQDSVFMMPHLGVLSSAYPDVAWNIFDKDCLIRLGTVIAPVGLGKEGTPVLQVKVEMPDGEKVEREVKYGEISLIPLAERVKAKATLTPARDFDIGAGPGKSLEKTVDGGVVGIVIDARGRPLTLPENGIERKKTLRRWYSSLDLYPMDSLEKGEGGV